MVSDSSFFSINSKATRPFFKMESVLSGREVPESSKLQGVQNYTIWLFRVCTILQVEGLWRLVDPNVFEIVSLGTSGASSSIHLGAATGEPGDASNSSKQTTTTTKGKSPSDGSASAKQTHLDSEKACALRHIVQTVKGSLVPLIMMMSDPRIVWIKLRDLYKSKFMNRRLTLKS
jgi:hypothetical protein